MHYNHQLIAKTNNAITQLKNVILYKYLPKFCMAVTIRKSNANQIPQTNVHF